MCREPERPGMMKGGSDHLAHRACHLDTLRSEKSHMLLKVQVTIFFFFVLEVVVLYIVLCLSVPQWHFINTFLTIFENFKLLWFLADQLSPCHLISSHKSLKLGTFRERSATLTTEPL